jgi:hypothetical protein
MRHLPWIDGAAGLIVGIAILALRGVLVDFYGLSPAMLTFIGCANVAYSLIGFTLGPRRPRPGWHLQLLVIANLAWGTVCIGILLRVHETATPFGLAHVIAEALFVPMLGVIEWRHRAEILAES